MNTHAAKMFVLGVIAACLLAVGWWARSYLDIEMSPAALRDFVAGLGVYGPLIFIGIASLRLFFLVPSQPLLVAGGLCFGTVGGTVYGAVGLALSGLWLFFASRWAGRELVMERMPEALRGLFDRSGSRGAVGLVALGTGYPLGPISAYHTLAGVTPMPLANFVVAVSIGATLRSGTFAFFGSSIIEDDPTALIVSTGVLAGVALVPLLFSPSRRWILRAVFKRSEAHEG